MGPALRNPDLEQSECDDQLLLHGCGGHRCPVRRTTVAPNSQISAFWDQAPLVSEARDLSGVRTFTFTSSVPVGVTALRGYTNERGEFLITTLPVVPLDTAKASMPFSLYVFPQLADGGGYTTPRLERYCSSKISEEFLSTKLSTTNALAI